MRGRRGARRGPAPVRSRRDRRGADSPRSGTRCRHQGGPGPDERARRGNKVRESPGHHPLDDLVHLFLDQPGYSRDAHGPALIDFRGRSDLRSGALLMSRVRRQVTAGEFQEAAGPRVVPTADSSMNEARLASPRAAALSRPRARSARLRSIPVPLAPGTAARMRSISSPQPQPRSRTVALEY
jgi:hypothetical protein